MRSACRVRAGSVSASAAKLLADCCCRKKPPSTPISTQMAAPRQPLRPRNVDDAALKPRGVDTTPQKLRDAAGARHDADGARHETDERLPHKKVRLLPKKRIRMLPARDEKWTCLLYTSPSPRDRG
mgnify:CR=1 FL=1